MFLSIRLQSFMKAVLFCYKMSYEPSNRLLQGLKAGPVILLLSKRLAGLKTAYMGSELRCLL